MKILLISGHGASDPGAVATVNGKTYTEAEETRKVTASLAKALKPVADVTVYPTARNAYADHRAGKLKAMAKFEDYDYMLEVHLNALKKSTKDGKTKGVEIYVTKSEKGTGVEEAICRNVAAVGLTNRGVKRTDFAVIKAAKGAGLSAALLELCFIDDPDDMKVYEANREKIVQAIAQGIVEGFGLKAAPAKPKTETAYKVKVTTALLNVRNAPGGDIVMTVKKGEVYTIVETSGSWGKLKSGAGWICLDYTTKC